MKRSNIAEKTANEEQITIKQEEPKRNFIIVYDSVYKNTKLTADELALIVKLLSLAPTFKPTKTKLMLLLHMTEYKLLRASKGLQEKGYLKIKKYGLSSEWIITQEPTLNLEDFTAERILNALLNYQINPSQVKQLHKLKYIDDRTYNETMKQYGQELIKRAKYNIWSDDDD